MSNSHELGALSRVKAYQIACDLRRSAWDDSTVMLGDARLHDVARQMIRAVGSVAANISEGYSRRSRAERIRFYEYALGSAYEASEWYESAERVLEAVALRDRFANLRSLKRLLLAMIQNERAAKASNTAMPSSADNRLDSRRDVQRDT
jgi:four helix bundle protein